MCANTAEPEPNMPPVLELAARFEESAHVRAARRADRIRRLKFSRSKEGEAAIGEDSLLERVNAAAEERQLSQNSKAALSLLYNVLGSVNPFAERLALKFAPEKAELGFHTPHSWKWRYSTI
jgi:hypothetical protein